MAYQYFSHNGKILPISQAAVPLGSVEYAYGFGVYETVRASGGQPKYLDEHCARLALSAKAIGLEHPFTTAFIQQAVQALVTKNEVTASNIKIMLIGGESPDLFIICSQPLFPDRKLYKQGAHTISLECERPFPHAKSLNMLPSYLAYRQAKTAGAYDALLVNRRGEITEGTRTNFFAVRGKTIISPPEAEVLLGVTRSHVIQTAKAIGLETLEQPIRRNNIASFDGAFITSTSSKVMPLRSIDEVVFDEIPTIARDLMAAFKARF